MVKYINLSPKEQEKYLIRKKDLLFNRTNSKELVGKTAVWNRNEKYAIAGYLIRCRSNTRGNPYYIWGFLNSYYGKKVLQNMCKNIVGMANINAQELQNIKINIPPIDIQNKYGNYIEVIESQKQKLNQEIQRSEALFQSLLQRAFKGALFEEEEVE